MSNTKTGLMFSPLTQNIYWGRMNTKTGIAIGNNKKDVTSDFIGIMLQKFEVNTRQNIECNGKIEAVVFVVDEEKSHKYGCVNEMREAMQEFVDRVDNGEVKSKKTYNKFKSILARAGGKNE